MTRAARATAPLAPLDGANLAIQDALNAALPALWFPLSVPDRARPMPPAAHALYVAHALVLRLPVRRRLGWPAWTLLTAASWALFTGAWDRRAVPAGTASAPRP